MKPRTKFQQSVVAASKHLPPLTPAQIEWGYKNCIVDNEKIMIGRNDDDGYYFKFGIYRVGNSTKPVCYNLANYSER